MIKTGRAIQESMQVYHWKQCAPEVVDAELLRKVEQGGQGTEGAVLAKWMICTKPRSCNLCEGTIKIGERALIVVLTNPSVI